jgi:catechol 2,3-dioxygenase-like lactoylglutathione lyase family enzyme
MTAQETSSTEAGRMALQTGGIHHLALRVADLERARAFYTTVLGFPEVLQTEGLVIVNVHGTFLGLRAGAPETDPHDRFSPFRVGLDHVALAAPSAAALQALQRQLDVAGIPNNGIEDDPLLGATYVAFYDPDGIAWELYALPDQSA